MRCVLVIILILVSNVVNAQYYQRFEEDAWRRRYPEIPRYAPYTPDYGSYRENGGNRFHGTPNPHYREEYPRIDYYRVYRCGRYGECVR